MENQLKAKGKGTVMNMGGKSVKAHGKVAAGTYWKNAGKKHGDTATNARSVSSGLPKAQSASDKNRYKGMKQPAQDSNVSGPKPCRFIS